MKRDLAQHLGRLSAEIMQTTPDLVHVTIRELGEGGVWHCSEDQPEPAAVGASRTFPWVVIRSQCSNLVIDVLHSSTNRNALLVQTTFHPGSTS